MQQENTLKKLTLYFRNHWFKIGIIAIALFVILKKDLSFNLNLNTPIRQKIEKEKQPLPVEQQQEEVSQERFTENTTDQSLTPANPAAVTDKFDLSPAFRNNDDNDQTAAERLATLDDEVKQKYIKRFGKVVISERRKFGIPSSIIIASALLHSTAGNSTLAITGNNHFNIKCTSDWAGEGERYNGKCYRYYENAWTSFRDHSLYITTGSFSKLRSLESDDYKGWAKALEKANYSDEPKLAKQLIQIIEAYQLHILDKDD